MNLQFEQIGESNMGEGGHRGTEKSAKSTMEIRVQPEDPELSAT